MAAPAPIVRGQTETIALVFARPEVMQAAGDLAADGVAPAQALQDGGLLGLRI
jgi:hypothetical protein